MTSQHYMTSQGLISIVTLWASSTVLFHCSEAKYVEGAIDTKENWIFLTRFCFYSHRGKFSYDVDYPLSYAVLKLLLYYDAPSQWPAVYKRPLSCEDKESVLSVANRQFVNLSLEDADMTCRLTEVTTASPEAKEKSGLRCTGERGFETARERWWFIAACNCNSSKGLKFNYRIRMTNGSPGDLRHEHFSADEFGMLEMSIAFLILHMVLFGMTIFSAVALKQRHLLHVTYKLFMASQLIHCAALLLMALHYSRFAMDGVGIPKSKLWGEVFESFGVTLFLLLLLLLAKGYTVTRARIGLSGTLTLTLFLILYSLTNMSLFFYKEQVFDPGEVLYLYESPAGHGLIFLKMTSWLLFLLSIVVTLKHYPEKALFYFPFLAFYTLWFVAGPIMILFSNYVIDKWVREKVVFGVELSIEYLAFLVFWCLTIPTFANINFPYHVRTTQIGIREVQSDGSVVRMNDDFFIRHPYAPSSPIANQNAAAGSSSSFSSSAAAARANHITQAAALLTIHHHHLRQQQQQQQSSNQEAAAASTTASAPPPSPPPTEMAVFVVTQRNHPLPANQTQRRPSPFEAPPTYEQSIRGKRNDAKSTTTDEEQENATAPPDDNVTQHM